jgi:hypothetical protein
MSDDRPSLPGSSARPSRSLLDPYAWLFGTTTQRLLLAVGVLAVAGQCLLFVRVPPASGYETSVVTAYPLAFWVLFGTGLGTVIAVLLGSTVTASRYWRHAYVLLACNYGLLFALPIARGYTMYGRGGSDVLYHLAAVKGIVASGFLPDFLFYPLMHLVLSELTLIGPSLEVARYLFPYVMTMLFIGSVSLVARELADDPRALPAGLCVAIPLVFGGYHLTLLPAVLSTMLFPLVLFIVERLRKTESKRYTALAVMFVLAIVFFHPVTTLFLIVLILSTVAFGYGYRWIGRGNTRRIRPILAVVALCAGFTWYIDFGRTQNAIVKLTEGKQSAAATQLNMAGEAALSTVDIATRFVQLYGTTFIVLSIAGLFCLIVCYRIGRHRHEYTETFGVYQFGIGFLIAASSLVVFLNSKNPIRVSRYMILIAVILAALFVHRAVVSIRTERVRQFVVLVLGCSIVVAALLGAFGTYGPNKHMTRAEYEGAEFMAEYPDDDLPVRSFALTKKMYRYVASGTDIVPWPQAYEQRDPSYSLAPRLGYGENATAAQSFGRSYLATQAYDTEQHTAAYFTRAQQREQFFYGEADVARMHRDPTVHKLYSNGGFTGWYVTNRSAG